MKLSANFTLERFFASESHPEIANAATYQDIVRGARLANLVLEPLLVLVPDLGVSSWFRCRSLNDAVGGVVTSEHRTGGGVDVFSGSKTPLELIDIIKEAGLPFDQLIPYRDGHLHIGLRQKNRGQVGKMK